MNKAGVTGILIVVAAALFNRKGQVLLVQRPIHKAHGGLWELPGGKLEPAEAPEAALARELAEELGITVEPAAMQPLTFASHAIETAHLLMPVWAVTEWQGTPALQEGQAGMAWVSGADLHDYPMPPADRGMIPVLQRYAATVGELGR